MTLLLAPLLAALLTTTQTASGITAAALSLASIGAATIYNRRLPKHYRGRALVRHLHSSSRYDRPPATLLRALLGFVKRADIVTLTEVNSEKRAASMRKVKGYSALRGHGFPAADESGIMWRAKVWRLCWSRCRELADKTGSQRLSIAGLAAIFRHHLTRQKVLVVVLHTPAGVEGVYANPLKYPKVAAHHVTVTALQSWVREIVAEHPDLDGIVIAADWNLNLFKDWVQAWVAREFPGLQATWLHEGRRSLPKRGSHGRRLIDWTLTNLRVWKVKLLRRNRSSDHCPYVETLILPAPPRLDAA